MAATKNMTDAGEWSELGALLMMQSFEALVTDNGTLAERLATGLVA